MRTTAAAGPGTFCDLSEPCVVRGAVFSAGSDEVCLAGRLRGRDSWRAAALYLALTLLFAYPLTRDPAGQVLADGPDTRLFLWTLGWDTHAFLHQPGAIFDANIYFPQAHTLAYSENLIGSAAFAAPVIWLTGNPVRRVVTVVRPVRVAGLSAGARRRPEARGSDPGGSGHCVLAAAVPADFATASHDDSVGPVRPRLPAPSSPAGAR